MTVNPFFAKDPDAVLDYTWDWGTNWLGTDTIISSTVDVPDGLTLDSNSNSTTRVTAWLSGGTAGATYAVTCRIVTTSGRTDDRTIQLSIKEQ